MKTGVEVCWNCVKGRHGLCTGRSEPEWPDMDEEQGPPCECPVDHADPRCITTIDNCRPIWVPAGGYYVSPFEGG